MARIRTIKPEFWTSEQNADCSRDARLLFIGLWNFCDDAGRHPASPMRLKMEVLPGDALGTQEVTRWVRELLDAGLLDEYEIDGETYWEVTGWHHQRIDQPNVRHPSRDGKVEPISPRRLGGKQRKLAYSHLVERDGEKCCNCGATNNLAVDHIVPISRGGTNKMDNLRLLCKLCNSEKGAKILAGDAPGTRQVRDGDSPPEGKGREGKGMEGKVSTRKRAPYETHFETFWEAFPKVRRQGKEAAAAAYKRAVIRLRLQPDAHAYLLERLALFAESDTAKTKYCWGPTPWLNQGHYDDDPAAWVRGENEPDAKPFRAADLNLDGDDA